MSATPTATKPTYSLYFNHFTFTGNPFYDDFAVKMEQAEYDHWSDPLEYACTRTELFTEDSVTILDNSTGEIIFQVSAGEITYHTPAFSD